ncbi:putative disease resistance RPP13-like protein 1 isoform X3 [Triticum dicoccoides]|uniref:putative disease resistance RPP13-like protein 1 isoform X3 n=1 Tax=Triticum dicoccoides TaxID=85692 RepID=UPI0018910011|nr:putative disease resistance RPP13-like protein 1 isoform X3 [Triticum dicoccoides]
MGMVLEAFAPYVMKMLVEMAQEEVGMLLGVSSEIESMDIMLGDLTNFLADADQRNLTDESVRDWVAQLTRAMYGATDIIDLCQLKAMESGQAYGMGCFNPLLFCIKEPFHAHDIGIRIKEFNRRLDAIRERGAAFNFVSLGSLEDHGGEVHTSYPCNRETSGELDQWNVVGEKIEEATEALVADIIKTRNEVNNDIAVVAIVGGCGIGKTTLAQKVFNDEAIQAGFDKRIWLSVNKNFQKAELLKTAIIEAGGDLLHHGNEALLVQRLGSSLEGKKVLLVMDDVWSPEPWDHVLRVPFLNGAVQGSRVLITTRNEGVARRMRAEHPYHRVDKLGPEDAWSLLKKQIISSEIDEPEIDMLKDIGLQIIANCGGLPLAVKVMGGLLCQRDRRQRDWEVLLNDSSPGYEMPKEINYSVYLSYEDLPPYLKQCFLHYSLLPTNTVFYENDIVGMWISEGFLHGNSQDLEGYLDLEDLGSEYYNKLIRRNLIEPDARYTSQRVCNMNDVVRSFAQSICRDEALVVAHNGDMYGYLSSRNFYRVSLQSKGLESDMLVWSLVQEQTSLRMLVSIGQIKLKPGDSLMAFPTLRILHIESTNAAAFVESLCQLKHLSYLSVAHTDVSSLPENINTMKFLQHINLQGCESFEKLPDGIIKLEQLRYLNLNDTGINVIPWGFHGLINLRKLYGFPAHMDGDWCSLEELRPLSQLREIGLKGLENIAAPSFAAQARLGEKVHLTYLKLECTSRSGGDELVKEGRGVFQDEEKQRIGAVFDRLAPPHCLSILDIQGYFGLQLPIWMRTTEVILLESLVVLTMVDLACCTQLPSRLCRLPNLRILKIQRAPAISRVGPEFLGAHEGHIQELIMFPRLRELVFFRMVEWEEWVWEKQVNAQAMPVLEELLLDNCKLSSLPPGLAFHARALKRLVITAAVNLSSLDSFASVVELDVYFTPQLRSITDLHELQKLTIAFCPKLERLIRVPAIRRLVLEDYDMETLPGYLQDVGNLGVLQLDCSAELLTSIALGKPGPEWKKYSHVKHVKAYAHDGGNRRKWYVLYTKHPYKLETNISQHSSKLAAVGKDEDKLIGKDEEYIIGINSLNDSVNEDNRELVGIHKPCEDLIKLLMCGDEKELKVVSICGTGGLGKTTIARAVYRKIANEFSCKAFVDVPRDPDIKVNIGTICGEVGCPRPKFEECDVQQLLDRLKIFFEEKRYLIILDGMWTTSVWDQILPALKENKHGSRIMITTQNASIAEHVGGLYHLPLLSYNDSNMLFFQRTLFGSERHCPPQFRELSKKMISRCGLLPLAIIVVTDLLPKVMVLDEWQKVCDSIEMGDNMENIRRVLQHTYDDLPQDLQRCLLCLGIFPEGYEIGRDSLVQRWIAENLICGERGQNLQELVCQFTRILLLYYLPYNNKQISQAR